MFKNTKVDSKLKPSQLKEFLNGECGALSFQPQFKLLFFSFCYRMNIFICLAERWS